MVSRGGKRRLVPAVAVASALLAALSLQSAYSATLGATADVTIAARPSIAAPDHPVTLYGTVKSGRPGEEILIQTKDCGGTFFRAVMATRIQSGGNWATEFFPAISTRVRAVWKGRASNVISVRQRAMLRFVPKASDRTRFVVSVVARAQFWRKRVVIERLNRARGAWETYRTILLTQQDAPGEFVWTSGEFTARLPRGTLLRAFLPQSQAGLCYLASFSLSLRTG